VASEDLSSSFLSSFYLLTAIALVGIRRVT
jgi:hypothetical protein